MNGPLLPLKWSPKGPLSHENRSLKGPLRGLLTVPYIIGIAGAAKGLESSEKGKGSEEEEELVLRGWSF